MSRKEDKRVNNLRRQRKYSVLIKFAKCLPDMVRDNIIPSLSKTKMPYNGCADIEICTGEFNDSWNGRFLTTSPPYSNYRNTFFIRDFNIPAAQTKELEDSKIEERFKATQDYVMNIFNKNDTITTTIVNGKTPVDCFTYGVDSLPLLLYGLLVFEREDLVDRYRVFLNDKIQEDFDIVADKDRIRNGTGITYKNYHFSQVLDHTHLNDSTYGAAMQALMSDCINKLNDKFHSELNNPYQEYDLVQILLDNYVHEDTKQGLEYFLPDQSGATNIAADANLLPYFLGVVKDKDLRKKSLEAIETAGLTKNPLCQYTRENGRQPRWSKLLAPGYQGPEIGWGWLASILAHVTYDMDLNKAKSYHFQHKALIEQLGTFPECYDKHGNLAKLLYYNASGSMSSWIPLHLSFAKKIGRNIDIKSAIVYDDISPTSVPVEAPVYTNGSM